MHEDGENHDNNKEAKYCKDIPSMTLNFPSWNCHFTWLMQFKECASTRKMRSPRASWYQWSWCWGKHPSCIYCHSPCYLWPQAVNLCHVMLPSTGKEDNSYLSLILSVLSVLYIDTWGPFIDTMYSEGPGHAACVIPRLVTSNYSIPSLASWEDNMYISPRDVDFVLVVDMGVVRVRVGTHLF